MILPRIPIPDRPSGAPLVVSYGMGTDSTALLVLLAHEVSLGNELATVERIQFADTGNELDHTYNFLPIMNEWLAKNNMPSITTVRRGGQDTSLLRQCERLGTMPSLAYGGKSCSLKWKVAAMESDIIHWPRARAAWKAGLTVHKMIGYDASPADLKRSKNAGNHRYTYLYPLRDARITRPTLQQIVADTGLPDPGKSACGMCPARKKPEIAVLMQTTPAKLADYLRVEAKAMLRTGSEKDDWSTEGLGRNYAWREMLAREMPKELEFLDARYDTGKNYWEKYLPMREMRDLRREADATHNAAS
jgi:hypothetical protein